MKLINVVVITASVFLLPSYHVSAQPFTAPLKVICEETEVMFAKLKAEGIGEEVVLMAEEDMPESKSYITLWMNKQNGTVSFVMTDMSRGISCVTAVGKNVKFKIGTQL